MANFVKFVYEGKERICNTGLIVELIPPNIGGSILHNGGYWTGYRYLNSPLEMFYFKTQEEAQELYDKLWRDPTIEEQYARNKTFQSCCAGYNHIIFSTTSQYFHLLCSLCGDYIQHNRLKGPTTSKTESDVCKHLNNNYVNNGYPGGTGFKCHDCGNLEVVYVKTKSTLQEDVELYEIKQKLDKIRDIYKKHEFNQRMHELLIQPFEREILLEIKAILEEE